MKIVLECTSNDDPPWAWAGRVAPGSKIKKIYPRKQRPEGPLLEHVYLLPVHWSGSRDSRIEESFERTKPQDQQNGNDTLYEERTMHRTNPEKQSSPLRKQEKSFPKLILTSSPSYPIQPGQACRPVRIIRIQMPSLMGGRPAGGGV